jgi:signal transduction histidine kinase
MAPKNNEAVLQDILAHLGFDDADRARLVALYAVLGPQLPELAGRLFERLSARPGTRERLSGAELGARLRTALTGWMTSGLCGPYDEEFCARRSQIARQHVAIGLPQQYLVTAMNGLRGDYDDWIDRLYEPGEARKVSRSLDKLLDAELALMLRYYQLDSESKLVARERSALSERIAAIQTLSAGLAHEVRNPLNSATLQLELLERRLRRDADEPQLIEPIELVRQEIERLTQMLTEFLAFARPSDLVLSDHDVVGIVRDVIAKERPAAEARGAVLHASGAAVLPASVDAHKLRQIIQNLVRNAVEVVPPGGRVGVTVDGDHNHVYLMVEDNGAGIPQDIRHRIYEPFFTTKDSGTGLGLAIVHGMVTLHGGTIAVDSSPRGTRFDVVLPRRGSGDSAPSG